MQKMKWVLGNWKMHKTAHQAQSDYQELCSLLASESLAQPCLGTVRVAIAAPSLFLADLVACRGRVGVFAQNAHWKNEGAFTGEISAAMLGDLGVKGSLVGHSERRAFFGETNHTAGLRAGALLKSNLKAVLCVGETLAQREAGEVESVLSAQIQEGLEGLFEVFPKADWLETLASSSFFVAYEPVWAIGTGRVASVEQIEQAHEIVRQALLNCGGKIASYIPILYGGSVKASNVFEIAGLPSVDGALVGGASLNPQEFFVLCQAFAGGL